MTTYHCENCHEDFESDWPMEEADKEYKENFAPEDRIGEQAIVCTPCYERIMESYKLALSNDFTPWRE